MSKYTPKLAKKIIELAKEGYIIDEIAEKVGLNPDTIYDWQKKKPEFSEAIKEAKLIPNNTVKASVFKSANGYEYTEKHVMKRKSGSNEYAEVKEITKHYAPNVLAQIFWLKNRDPQRWKDRHDVGFDPDTPLNINIREITVNGKK